MLNNNQTRSRHASDPGSTKVPGHEQYVNLSQTMTGYVPYIPATSQLQAMYTSLTMA